MQLVHLLGRLDANDRAELLRRRPLSQTVPFDDSDLANVLSRPDSIRTALYEINSLQLSILQWLAHQPGHETTWKALVDEVGDAVKPAELALHLDDLRLWGLADFVPDEREGLVAMYAAVGAALPSDRHPKLASFLSLLSSDQLRLLGGRLGLTKLPTLKDKRLLAILQTTSNPAAICQRMDALSPEARAIFERVREAGGKVRASDLDTHILALWPQYASSAHPAPRPVMELATGCLLVADTVQASYSYYDSSGSLAVPQEVERVLSPGRSWFSGPLSMPVLQAAADVNPVHIPSAMKLMRDVGHFLGFIAGGYVEWRQDGGAYQRSMQALAKKLGADDAYPHLLYRIAETFGLLEKRYQASPVVSKGLAKLSPRGLYRATVNSWAAVAGAGHWYAAGQARPRARVRHFLASCPTDTWFLKSSLLACLEYLWPVVFSPDHGNAAQDSALWHEAQAIFLGHGTSADGEEALLIRSEVQSLLSDEPDTEQAGGDAWTQKCTVLPDRSFIAPPDAHPSLLVSLWQTCELESCQGASVFRITAASVKRALNRGMTPAGLQKLLAEVSDGPLPETVERLVSDQTSQYGRLKVGPADAYLRVDDPALLDEVLNHRLLRDLRWTVLGPDVACATGTDQVALLGILRTAGYLPGTERPTQRKPGRDKAARARGKPGLTLVTAEGDS